MTCTSGGVIGSDACRGANVATISYWRFTVEFRLSRCLERNSSLISFSDQGCGTFLVLGWCVTIHRMQPDSFDRDESRVASHPHGTSRRAAQRLRIESTRRRTTRERRLEGKGRAILDRCGVYSAGILWSSVRSAVASTILKYAQTQGTNGMLTDLALGTMQWVCLGCIKKRSWTYKQCRHRQKHIPGQLKHDCERTTHDSCCSQESSIRNREKKNARSANKKRANQKVDQIEKQVQEEVRRGSGCGTNLAARKYQCRRCSEGRESTMEVEE